jgi:hypothetical protein
VTLSSLSPAGQIDYGKIGWISSTCEPVMRCLDRNSQPVAAMADNASERIHRMGRADFLYSIMAGQASLDLSRYGRFDFLYAKRHAPRGLHLPAQFIFGQDALQRRSKEVCAVFDVSPLVGFPLLPVFPGHGNADKYDKNKAEYREKRRLE